MTRIVHAHASGEEFVLLLDPGATVEFGPELVQVLAFMRGPGSFSAGGPISGAIRVTRTQAILETEPVLGQAYPELASTEWFMDYRRVDGTIVPMCGGGLRLLAELLATEGLIPRTEVQLGTRAGCFPVSWAGDELVVAMGRARWQAQGTTVTFPGSDPQPALHVWLGTANAVLRVDLSEPLPGVPLAMPQAQGGTSVVLADVTGPGELSMRVFEPGLGERRTCGTSACAAAVAAQQWGEVATTWQVSSGGQTQRVEFDGSQIRLIGPASLGAVTKINLPS